MSNKPLNIPGVEPVFATDFGRSYLGNCADLLKDFPANSVQLVCTSPPWAVDELTDNSPQTNEVSPYADWLGNILRSLDRILHKQGHLILELGPSWSSGFEERQLQGLETVVRLHRTTGWHLLQEFYYYCPTLLGPADDVDVTAHGRYRETISTIWWFSPDPSTKPVLQPINTSSNPLISTFGNLLMFGESEHDARFRNQCQKSGIAEHPEPFPITFAEFFIRLLTKPDDVVLDPFAGSCTTGAAAERLGRRWVCIDNEPGALALASLRVAATR